MTRWVGAAVRATAMVLAGLVLAHSLIFLAAYCAAFGDALSRTGHDHGWNSAAAAALTLGASLLAAMAWRLHRLRHTAVQAGAVRLPAEPGPVVFLRHWLVWWVALAVAIAVLFVLEENLELSHVSNQLPGIRVLASATYPGAVAIIAAVALVVSLLAGLLSWELDLLEARIRAMKQLVRGELTANARIDVIDRRLGSVLGRGLAGRAPPLCLAL
ncbi:MAG: hypothetical protein ACXWMN_02715 [Candidatus Limnocylindria bacterium]